MLYVDSFAGGGGASTGIRLAIGHDVDIAINHDPAAILMHEANHPHSRHYRDDVWQVDPREACQGQPVQLAWFSPDCKHFSRAKGAALVDKKIRGLAWVVLRWAALVKPAVIMLENVPEFVTWGPVRKGRPIKAKAGKTFARWYAQLAELGYRIEYRELTAADYGAPTSRRRLYIIARRDGKPITWPTPTHGNPDSEAVQSGRLHPWRSAASIIDWTLPCPSIFDGKQAIKDRYGLTAVRPLADNTLRRIAVGLDKFVIRSARPYIVAIGQTSSPQRARDTSAPLSTVVSKAEHCLCDPVLTPYVMNMKFDNNAENAGAPVSAITAVNSHLLSSPRLVQYHQEKSTGSCRGQALDKPLLTQDASSRYGMQMNFLSEWYGNARDGIDLTRPMPTQTAKDRDAVTTAFIHPYYGGGYKVCGHSAHDPLPTVTAADHNALEACHLAEFKGADKGQAADMPLRTITASVGEFGTVQTRLARCECGCDLGHWPQVRTLLNRFCGYTLGDNEVLLLGIDGRWYFIGDIGLRMLSPRELFNAQGFPADYIIDRDSRGKPYPKAAQVARCGNAVCPPVAYALVRANLPDACAESEAA